MGNNKGLMELRERMMVNVRKARTIEEADRIVTASRSDEWAFGEGGGWDLLSGGHCEVQGQGHHH